MQSIRLVIEGEPIPKARARVVTSKGRDGKKGRTHSYTPKTTEVAENAIKAAARAANATLLTGDLRIEVIFYRSSARRCDVDNMLKTATDALNGVAYMDDSQITDVIARKRIDRKRPRTELVIESIAEGA